MQSGFQQSINVYLRNSRKQARVVNVKTPIKSQHILSTAAQQFILPLQEIILFYNGFRIDKFTQLINLTEKSIVHVIDRRNIDKPEIYISFKAIGWNGHAFKLAISPEVTVKELLSESIVPRYGVEEQRLFVVYAGRVLRMFNRLIDQFVQDGTQLYVAMHKPIQQLFKKESMQFYSSEQLNLTYQSGDKVKAPVSYQTSLSALKKKSLQQASLQQQQVTVQQHHASLQQNYMNIQYNQTNAAPYAGHSQDSFFIKAPENQVHEQKEAILVHSILQPQHKKSSISSERNAPSQSVSNDEQKLDLLSPQDIQKDKILKLQSNKAICDAQSKGNDVTKSAPVKLSLQQMVSLINKEEELPIHVISPQKPTPQQ